MHKTKKYANFSKIYFMKFYDGQKSMNLPQVSAYSLDFIEE